MSGSVISNASHPPPPPLSGSSVSTSPMASNPPNVTVSAPGPPPPVQMQYRPVASVPPPGGQAFPPQFRPVPSVPPNMGMGPPSVTSVVPPLQGTHFNQQQRPFSGPMQVVPQSQPMNIPPPGIVRVNPPPTFTFVPNQNFSVIPHAPPAQPWTMGPAQTPSQIGQTGQQNSLTVNSVLGHSMPAAVLSDWQEHIAPDGRRYYYNRRTRQSSWEKPVELMTPLERADASTVWKEFTAADGRKYYYNKVTKQSTWTIPEELRQAREQTQKSGNSSTSANADVASVTSPGRGSTISSISAPVSITPANLATTALSKPSSPGSGTGTAGDEGLTAAEGAAPAQNQDASVAADDDSKIAKKEEIGKTSEEGSQKKTIATEESSTQDLQDAKSAMPSTTQIHVTPLIEEKPLRHEETNVYANKNEARNAFRDLLESVNVASDWTWEQAMRLIINDKRYGALKTLSERKQAFTEYLSHRKKQEAEEKRARQKKAREDFISMLKESKELSSKMRWSKIVSLFGDDPRFNAVERDREREELFEDYVVELEAKEKERAREERKKRLLEYRKFLESCDFIKPTTQWRKVADKLEDDERCYRLAKPDRIEVFQEYIRDLEKAEEEEKKIQKEQQRRRERKNRDDFRKLMEEHRGSGILTARISWREYASMVKDNAVYLAVCSNTSGTTAKELFEDLAEDMEKQYIEDKAKIRDYIKSKKIDITPDWTFEKFRSTVAENSSLLGIMESNFRIVFNDLLERAIEKEEKETKRRKRAVDDFVEFLHLEKSISSSSTWEDCHVLLEGTPQYRALNDETVCKKLFNDYVMNLQQKTQEKDKKREEEKERRDRDREKDKDKEKSRERDRKEKDRVKEKSSKKEKENVLDDSDVVKSSGDKDEQKKEKHGEKSKHRDKKHKKHHRSKNSDDLVMYKSEKDEPKKSRRHNGEKKKSSRKHGHEQSSDAEHKHKKHRRDQEKGNGKSNDLEDGELGEDGEHS